MEQNQVVKIRKRRRSKKGLVIISLAMAMVFLPGILVLILNMNSNRNGARIVKKTMPAIEQVEEPETASSEVRGKWYGLCKKAVVKSVDDLRRIVESDSVLAAHFEGFDWAKAKHGTLEQAVWTPMAYRSGDTVAMTKKRVMLPKGDGYITDGNRRVRTFCCNDYTESAPPPQVLAPPTEEQVDSAVPRREGAEPPLEIVAGPPAQYSAGSPAQSSAGPPPRMSLAKPPVAFPPRRPPPTTVPEPGSILLFGAGAAVFGAWRWLSRRNK